MIFAAYANVKEYRHVRFLSSLEEQRRFIHLLRSLAGNAQVEDSFELLTAKQAWLFRILENSYHDQSLSANGLVFLSVGLSASLSIVFTI